LSFKSFKFDGWLVGFFTFKSNSNYVIIDYTKLKLHSYSNVL